MFVNNLTTVSEMCKVPLKKCAYARQRRASTVYFGIADESQGGRNDESRTVNRLNKRLLSVTTE